MARREARKALTKRDQDRLEVGSQIAGLKGASEEDQVQGMGQRVVGEKVTVDEVVGVLSLACIS